MKKRILFVITNFGTGGILRSLQNFLNRYDSSTYDVDVFALTHQGLYRDQLPNCRVLPRHRFLDASLARFEKQSGTGKVESFVMKILNKVTGYRFQSALFRKVANKLVQGNEYDAVIAFSEGVPTAFVACMNHSNKIGWIHCDYASYMQINGGHSELATYDKLQHIVCVSEFTRQSFVHIYPTIADKTEAVYNIIDDEMMLSKAKEPIKEIFDDSCFNIVSVGRIDPVKRLSIVPELARKVTDAGCKIRWYVIGPKGTDGEVRLFEENRKKYNVEDVVFPLGEKANPYPYIAKADLLVNTSISEACPYVINEAKILGTPVVCTDFGSAKEFVDYGINGFYEPIERISDRIISLVNNPNELRRMKEALKEFRYDNEHILNKIYSLI